MGPFQSCLSQVKSVLLFSAPMSQAIFNLNYLHHSAVFVDTIFAHPELIVSVY